MMQEPTYFKASHFSVCRTILELLSWAISVGLQSLQSSVREAYIRSCLSVLLVGTETKQRNSKGQFLQVPIPHTLPPHLPCPGLRQSQGTTFSGWLEWLNLGVFSCRHEMTHSVSLMRGSVCNLHSACQ